MHSGLSDCREHPEEYIRRIRELSPGETNIMEVCGTHTMAIAHSGIRSLLPEKVHLLSGPGCPVCVTPAGLIDAVLELARRPEVVIASYGDMLRVPGSRRGENLAGLRMDGACVEVVYSPMDALELAERMPEREIVFLGVGFETTAPGTGIAVTEAERRQLKNFSVLSMLKTVEPGLRALIRDPDFAVNGFLCPGHVAVITGAEAFRFLPEEYQLPAVVSGFEPEDILFSIWRILDQLAEGKPALENTYGRAVRAEGNPLAMKIIRRVFVPCTVPWRGMGPIPGGGLAIAPEYRAYDAAEKFGITIPEGRENPACRCGDVIQGKCRPGQCPLFGRACTPEDPVGPCMVSAEGACAAAMKYPEL